MDTVVKFIYGEINVADEIGGVWRTVGGRRIFIKDGQDLVSAMKESGKFKKIKKLQQDVSDAMDIYGFNKSNTFEFSDEVKKAIEKRDKQYKKMFKNEEEKQSYLTLIQTLGDKNIPNEVKNELLKFKVINKSPYSNSFYNTGEIKWGSKPNGSIRISDHWNFESRGEIHCKLKGVDKYTVGWKMAKYEDGEYTILKEFE